MWSGVTRLWYSSRSIIDKELLRADNSDGWPDRWHRWFCQWDSAGSRPAYICLNNQNRWGLRKWKRFRNINRENQRCILVVWTQLYRHARHWGLQVQGQGDGVWICARIKTLTWLDAKCSILDRKVLRDLALWLWQFKRVFELSRPNQSRLLRFKFTAKLLQCAWKLRIFRVR